MSGGLALDNVTRGATHTTRRVRHTYTNTVVTHWLFSENVEISSLLSISTFCRRQESAVVTEFCNLVIVNKSMLSYKRKYRFWDSLSPKSDLKKIQIYIITLGGPKDNTKNTRPIVLKFTQSLYLRAGLLWKQKYLFWDKNKKCPHVFAPFWGFYFKLWVTGKNQENEMHFLHILWKIGTRVETRQRS